MNPECVTDGSGRPKRSTSQPELKAAKVRALSGCESFSAPIASATSASPAAIAWRARWTAVDPEAQAFSTLAIGAPSRPVSWRATWPRIACWSFSAPSAVLAKNTASTCAGAAPASASAPAAASAASDRSGQSGNLPNGVVNAPAT
jgi:hypothetical protein